MLCRSQLVSAAAPQSGYKSDPRPDGVEASNSLRLPVTSVSSECPGPLLVRCRYPLHGLFYSSVTCDAQASRRIRSACAPDINHLPKALQMTLAYVEMPVLKHRSLRRVCEESSGFQVS